MKKGLIASISIATLFFGTAIAASASESSYDFAKVVGSEPITRIVRVSTPRQECWDEEVSHTEYGDRSHGVGTVVGAILGGALGNAVGHRTINKKVGTVVGAVLGGTLGHAHDARRNSNDHSYTTTEERCEVYQEYEEHEKIVGYRISYRYNGKIYTTRSDTAPGKTIKVRVTVSAV